MNDEKKVTYFFVAVIVIILTIFVYQPYREKEVFNKFKDPDQPEATYVDALFSNLRITSK